MIKLGRRRAWAPVLLGCVLVASGCSTTGGSRFRSAEGSRSIASVAGQPLPPTVGGSGERVAAAIPDPEPRRNPNARISGRVVDPKGRAVAGATVRLADGASRAGRDVHATTDASGAFTLGGLRPGSTYVLVAEASFGADRGLMTGRAEAETADTGVQIRLADGEAEGDDAIPAPATRSRARPISERVDASPKVARRDGVNGEDLGPPAEPAEAVDGDGVQQAAHRRPRSAAATSGWKRPGATTPAAEPDEVTPTRGDPADDATLDAGAPRSRPRPTRAVDSDEVNPLPPSLPAPDDSAADVPARRRPRPDPADPDVSRRDASDEPGQPAVVAEVPPAAPAGGTGLMAMPSLASLGAGGVAAGSGDSRDPDPTEIPELPPAPPPDSVALDESGPTLAPTPTAPGAVVSAPGSAAPALADASADYNPFALVAAAPPPSPPAATAREFDANQPDVLPPTRPAPAAEPDAPARPKRWGELASATTTAAVAASPALGGATRPAATKVSATPATRPGSFLGRRGRAAAAAAAATPTPAATPAPVVAQSQFDARANQLVDFQLPGVDGQPVRFRDLDADFVVLDFWGTWCKECMDSIPQLVALQKKYGPETLRVVGIACEREAAGTRNTQVAAAAERLGINYSVLVASLDDDPVQRDFQVRFYPTMVLLDRRGKVLFRGEGGTESNMFRLEKALTSARKASPLARR